MEKVNCHWLKLKTIKIKEFKIYLSMHFLLTTRKDHGVESFSGHLAEGEDGTIYYFRTVLSLFMKKNSVYH